MPVPQIQNVHPVFQKKVEIPSPEMFIVEKWEFLRCVAVVVLCALICDFGPLHSNAGTAQQKRWMIAEIQFRRKSVHQLDSLRQLKTAVEHSRWVTSHYKELPPCAKKVKGLVHTCRKRWNGRYVGQDRRIASSHQDRDGIVSRGKRCDYRL